MPQNSNNDKAPYTSGQPRRLFKKADFVLLVFLVLITAASWIWLAAAETTGAKVTIKQDGELYGTYQLSEDREITVTDENDGENVVIIKDGSVIMKSASCHNQVCVNHAAISKTGESIICLPNKVIVSIENENGGDEYDAISN